MCKNSGFCGSVLRILLTIINVMFLLLGITIFVVAAILKWDKSSIFNKLNEQTQGHVDLNALSSISTGLIIIGSAMIVIAIVGLIGACCANRFFLVIYEIVLILLFIAHLVLLIIVIVEAPAIENAFRKELSSSVDAVNNATTAEYPEKCKELKAISEVFKCCGYNDTSDLPPLARPFCCDPNLTNPPGCAQKVVDDINDGAVYIIIIPNSVVLGIELLLIIALPFLIVRLSKKKEEYTPTYHNNNASLHKM